MLEFYVHICWVITVLYKVRLGQVKSEFDWKRPKLTRSVRASKLSIFSVKYNSVHWIARWRFLTTFLNFLKVASSGGGVVLFFKGGNSSICMRGHKTATQQILPQLCNHKAFLSRLEILLPTSFFCSSNFNGFECHFPMGLKTWSINYSQGIFSIKRMNNVLGRVTTKILSLYSLQGFCHTFQ